MGNSSKKGAYFTRHLFRTACQCPTRLYYKARPEYPEARSNNAYVDHMRINKKLLIDAARQMVPGGRLVTREGKQAALAETAELLGQKQVILYDALLDYEQFIARIPILEKADNTWRIYLMGTKVYSPHKHDFEDSNGVIRNKWLPYVQDAAYYQFVLHGIYPDADIESWLILPDKSSTAARDGLLFELLNDDVKPAEVAGALSSLMVMIEMNDYVAKVQRSENKPLATRNEIDRKPFEERLRSFRDLYLEAEKFQVPLGRQCRRCEFRVSGENLEDGQKSGFHECWGEGGNEKGETPEHVYDLIGPGAALMIEEGTHWQHRVNLDSDINTADKLESKRGKVSTRQRQALQVLKARDEAVPREVIRPQLFREMNRWEYPLHFLDFEAGNFVIPMKKGQRPYAPVLFQFSCHTLYENEEVRHYDWLDVEPCTFPSYEAVRALRSIPDINRGTILQYSPFEKHMLKIIRRELKREDEQVEDREELMEWIHGVISRPDSNRPSNLHLVDLNRLVQDYYYNAFMINSLSIKDVLESVMSISPYLKEHYSKPYNSNNYEGMIWWRPKAQKEKEGAMNPYKVIESLGREIREGAEAMVAYSHLQNPDLSQQIRRELKEALLKYCELDTLAMLMIVQHWQSVGSEHPV